MKSLIPMLLLLPAVSSCFFSSIEAPTEEPDNTTPTCTPNMTCIPQESLPQIQNLTDTFVNDLNKIIKEIEENRNKSVQAEPELRKKGAEIMKTFVETLKANPKNSCVFSKDCWENLDELVKELEKEEPSSTLKVTAATIARRMRQLRLLKIAFKVAVGLLRRIYLFLG